MRILHILDHSLPLQSGYVYRTLGILREQRKLGWETLHLTSAKQGESARPRRVDGWHFFRTGRLPQAYWHWPLLRQIGVVLGLRQRLLRLARKTRPRILHAHSPALNGLAALYVGRKLGLPVLYEVRAFWEDAAGDGTPIAWRGARYWLTRALENYVLQRADAVTTICQGLHDDLLQRGVAPAKLTIVANAVAMSAAPPPSPAQHSVALAQQYGMQDKLVLGFIGSYYAYEGLAFLIRALPAMLALQPHLHLLCVGGGPQEQRLHDLVQRLGLATQVTFAGRVAHHLVPEFYRLATVMVYPRLSMRLTELVTPLKPLEAMALGRLVLASDVGGHRELIEHGRTGALFRAGDAQDLSRVLLELLAHPQHWSAMRERACQYVLNERSWQRSVAAYLPVYEQLVSERGHNHG